MFKDHRKRCCNCRWNYIAWERRSDKEIRSAGTVHPPRRKINRRKGNITSFLHLIFSHNRDKLHTLNAHDCDKPATGPVWSLKWFILPSTHFSPFIIVCLFFFSSRRDWRCSAYFEKESPARQTCRPREHESDETHCKSISSNHFSPTKLNLEFQSADVLMCLWTHERTLKKKPYNWTLYFLRAKAIKKLREQVIDSHPMQGRNKLRGNVQYFKSWQSKRKKKPFSLLTLMYVSSFVFVWGIMADRGDTKL